ncbi:hypothetical protein [Pseudonocardia alni]|uniref:hypothetical protein n=1 Tax=Pseudonocardia alni TaxID=33907 RepID=UPI0033CDF393
MQVVSAQMRGGPAEHHIEYPPLFAGPPGSTDSPGFVDHGVPVWTLPWTAITQPGEQPDDSVRADASPPDVAEAVARLRDVLTARGIDIGSAAEQTALDVVLAVLQPHSPRP